MDIETKEKSAPSFIPRRAQGYIALAVAVGLCFAFMGSVLNVVSAFLPYKPTSFYPLVLLVHYPPLRLVLWAGLLIILGALISFAFRRRVMYAVAVAVMLPGMCILLTTLVIMFLGNDLTPRQTLTLDGHIYHVLQMDVVGRIAEFVKPSKSYVVVQCDASGLICRYYAMPYRVEGYNASFEESVELIVTAQTRELSLRVGSTLYAVKDERRLGSIGE